MANVSDLRITPHVECLAGADFARCDFGRAGVGRDCHQHGERLRRRQSGPGVSGQPEPVFADGSAGASLNWAGQNTTAAAVAPGGLTDFDAAIGSNAIGGVVTRNGETYVMNAVQSATGNDNATITLSSITDWIVGGVLNSIKFLGNEAAQAMDTTVPAAAGAGANLALMDAQPQSTGQLLNAGDVQVQNTGAPSQTEFAAFADAMSTSYGAPIELVSVDPFSGAQTELADTSAGNLLAELPVLETQANGVNLGLQLADGTQVQFASTARLATFLYSLAVQQMQATSFVTDNYNLDMQWLNTVDQPLLQEGVYWSERATAEAPVYPERTVEDNVHAEQAFSGGENVQAILSLA